jgi:25S rRNA (cytosine2870-C5)-methyltransferase
MGVNAGKRKKKQGPVPTLEESLRKKPKRETNDDKKQGKKTDVPTLLKEKAEEPVGRVEEETLEEEGQQENLFVATKASLFDDDDEIDEFDVFENGNEGFSPPQEESDPRDDGNEIGSASDSDDESQDEGMFSDSSGSDELTAANMEALSTKLDQFAWEDILAAQDELLNPAQPVAEGVLDSGKSEDLSSVKTRIMEIVRVLGDFKNLREDGLKRKDYIEKLVDDIAAYYSYNIYLARKFLEMFSVQEVPLLPDYVNLIRLLSSSKPTKFQDPSSFERILWKRREEI